MGSSHWIQIGCSMCSYAVLCGGCLNFHMVCLLLGSEKLLVLLRDGRKLMGILRSFDQFGMLFIQFLWLIMTKKKPFFWWVGCLYSAANAVLEGACERLIVGDLYCDIPLGLYVIRGENVVLIGELVGSSFWSSDFALLLHHAILKFLSFISGFGKGGASSTHDSCLDRWN